MRTPAPRGRSPARTRAIAAALIVACVLAYVGRRLWLKSDDLLRPVVILRGPDAGAMAAPGLGARLAALTAENRAPDGARPKLIALTFDDGPYPVVTPLLLQTLHDLHVRATFFLIGRDAEQFPELTREIAAGGHEIADHTLTHPNLDQLSVPAVSAELAGGARALEQIAPDPAERRMFRPPHGRYTAATVQAASRGGFDTILWTDDPGDWRAVEAPALQEHLIRHAAAPEIVLLHSGRTATVAALGGVVARFRAAGYRFVTVSELLRSATPEQVNRPVRAPLAGG